MVEYTSIMKNDLWDTVARTEAKSIVTSRWLNKLNHVANGSIESKRKVCSERILPEKGIGI